MRAIKDVLAHPAVRRVAPEVSRKMVETYWSAKSRRLGPLTVADLEPEVVFVWIPKAAGSSMARWLRKNHGLTAAHNIGRLALESFPEYPAHRGITLGHQNVDSLVTMGLLRAETLNAAFSFAIVRNPYTRLASLWRYLIKLRDFPASKSFDDFVHAIAREKPRPGAYNACGLSMASPMSAFTTQYSWSGPQQIFHFEQLEQVVSELQNTLGIAADFPQMNVGEKIAGPIPLSGKTVSTIQRFYERDFHAFDYDTEPPSHRFQVTN